jgi:hypothetical protein
MRPRAVSSAGRQAAEAARSVAVGEHPDIRWPPHSAALDMPSHGEVRGSASCAGGRTVTR